ncbi:class I SAM-dependent methyltransferase [Actinacidiphila sp. bgisy160]|uniref:class I SAM-dependent methyltransferase n=1 Tax=Actinacidiphila sp. bgisy160 TaxID=3413796 RepID=UPI003D72628F
MSEPTSEPHLRDRLAHWDGRHRGYEDLASSGRTGLDRPGDEIFHALRFAGVLRITGDSERANDPLLVLDAGCGRGRLARALARCGHLVDAIDAGPSAVEHCRALGGGPRYAVAELSAWRSPWLYDVVLAVDVLFHVLDDAAWRAALVNLGSLVRLTGRLVVTDEDAPGRVARGDYILHRPAAEYRAAVEPLGLRYGGFTPYGFRENRVGFHVFTRTS